MKSLLLNSRKVSFEDIQNGKVVAGSSFEESTLAFCRQWLNGQASFSLKTSGSTGHPKTIVISREQMQLSARQTIEYFNISPVDTVLVCLNTAYIAGIMMLVRGFESGAKIVVIEPEGNPLNKTSDHVDFLAVVPLQLEKILSDPDSLNKLEKCRTTLVGGAPVSIALERQLSNSKAAVYATFAMTETLTHFAIKQLNPNKEELYSIMKGVKLGQDDRGCLTISSPVTQNKRIVTNDLVELHEPDRFKWLGRFDNVINSGGVKIHVEILEKKIETLFYDLKIATNFFITSMPDSSLGEKVVLIVEKKELKKKLEDLNWSGHFDQYEKPREIIYLPQFKLTPTGKIDRNATIGLVK